MPAHSSGWCGGKQAPSCDWLQQDAGVSPLIRRSWEGSGRVYGYSKLGHDLWSTTLVLPNHLDRQFELAEPSEVWATDITYIRTHEGGCIWELCTTCSRARWWAGQSGGGGRMTR